MNNNYVKLVHYYFEDKSKDYSVIYVLDEDKREIEVYRTYDQKVQEEIDRVLDILSTHNIITLSIKHKG